MSIDSHRPVRRDTRRGILDAAIDCFEKRGLSSTVMEDIAEAAGLTRSAVYYHFKNKRDLVQAVLIEAGTRVVKQVETEIAYQPATLELVSTASVRMVELSLADPVTRSLATPEGEALVAPLLRDAEIREVQAAFWLPLLNAAAAAGEVRADIEPEEIINWLIFLQLSFAAVGADFGLLGHDRHREIFRRFVAPGLEP